VSKKSTKRFIGGGAIVLAAIVMMIFAGECPAFPYRPAAAVSIQSEYSAFKSSARPNTQVWRVVPETGPAGATILRFFLEATAEATALCEIRLPAPGAPGEIQWSGAAKTGQKKTGRGILLLPGFPAPCDVLPVGTKDSSAVYTEKTEAGGRVFSKTYRVAVEAVSDDAAKAMGYLRAEVPGRAGLVMVSVIDEAGRPVVKQLWPADGAWWLYEETPVRRSWLIY
jgi:hypothetical protein